MSQKQRKRSIVGGGDHGGMAKLHIALQTTLVNRAINQKVLEVSVGEEESRWSGLWVKLDALATWKFKLVLFRLSHLFLSLVVWQHFFYNKWKRQEGAVPEGAPNFWWKRLVPPIEFGLMHAILLQISLVPLTVSRSLLAALSTNSILSEAIPFNYMMDFHIQIGYTFCIVMIASSILFFVFFGHICSEFNKEKDPLDLCANFSKEIFGTGLAILAITLVVFFTSCCRGRIKYEYFYFPHLLVFAMYLLALVHTLDDEFRKGTKVGKARSQTVKWFVTSLTIYLSDRFYRYFNRKNKTPVVAAFNSEDGGTIHLEVKRPFGYNFSPGQYACIQIPAIDYVWHPFSIGSRPGSSELLFLIEVKKPTAWTGRLAALVDLRQLKTINLAGPFGYPVAHLRAHGNVVAIGTGTGIVPMLSMCAERAYSLGQLGKAALASAKTWQEKTHANSKEGQESSNAMLLKFLAHPLTRSGIRQAAVLHMESQGEGDDLDVGSAFVSSINLAKYRWRLKMLREKGSDSAYYKSLETKGTKLQAKVLWQALTMVFVLVDLVVNIGLVVSWANHDQALTGPPTPAMNTVARNAMLFSTVVFCLHVAYRFAIKSAGTFVIFDLLGAIGMVTALAFWWDGSISERTSTYAGGYILDQQDINTTAGETYAGLMTNSTAFHFVELDGGGQLLRSALAAWRIMSFLLTRNARKKSGNEKNTGGPLGVHKFQMIWCVRHTDLVMGYLAYLEQVFTDLDLRLYGHEVEIKDGKFEKATTVEETADTNLRFQSLQPSFDFLSVRIYCTDPDEKKCAELRAVLNRKGMSSLVKFERCKMAEHLKAHMHRQIMSGIRANTAVVPTQVTFCGSPIVSKAAKLGVQMANHLATQIGVDGYHFSYREEFYGYTGTGSKSKRKKAVSGNQVQPSKQTPLENVDDGSGPAPHHQHWWGASGNVVYPGETPPEDGGGAPDGDAELPTSIAPGNGSNPADGEKVGDSGADDADKTLAMMTAFASAEIDI